MNHGTKRSATKKKKVPAMLIVLCLVVIFIVIGIVYKKYCKTAEKVVEKETLNTEPSVVITEEKPKVKKYIPDTVTVYKKTEKNIKIPVLIYHAFAVSLPEDPYHLFVTPERFEQQINVLLQDGYTFVTLEELAAYNKGEIGLPEKVVIITIDDGWRGLYTDILPILKTKDIPVTAFVVNALMGTEGYFSWEEAKEMFDTNLVKIQSHGKKHIDYSTVSKEVLQQQLQESQKEIDEKMGKEVPKYFAYPSGKHTDNSVNWLKEIGFEVQVMTRYGTVNRSIDLDVTNIGRIRCQQDTTGEQILNTIHNAKLTP